MDDLFYRLFILAITPYHYCLMAGIDIIGLTYMRHTSKTDLPNSLFYSAPSLLFLKCASVVVCLDICPAAKAFGVVGADTCEVEDKVGAIRDWTRDEQA
ncbi:hypothetical protein GUITHDRAFT_105360 [Guillardia theta CCMP2712]|uniref:Uncharacterized protein n=1 Tax=Guillardia theta (strain CCMP2712) TaxID=905079 RepID=L1JJM3_GUITC|nr:hypothetical protein GUITHDRAFT_105360 [Guillardia theta CCMP2712]EKX48733.1 hypothetical protein GUITHDRAFT_105360 [Guillardia theta CCMP2712]|eukprot:XP_005835713.1 hypothetical protein GUITHDRAFT_105360 [Guillardia theta CCMP2712]